MAVFINIYSIVEIIIRLTFRQTNGIFVYVKTLPEVFDLKKFIPIAAIVLCVCLIVTAVCLSVFKVGHNKATLCVQSVSANTGDTVMIPVDVLDNPGISDIAFSVSFDNTVLTYKNFYGSLIDGCEVFDHSDEGYITLASIGNDGMNVSGSLVYFEFDIKEDANPSTLPLALKDLHLDDAKGKSVKVDTRDGELTITLPCSDEHNYVSGFFAKEPTCTTDGLMVDVCADCGHMNIYSTPAKGHTVDKAFVLDVAAANGEPGMLSQHCTACGAKTNIMIYTEENDTPLGINAISETLDGDSIKNVVYFLNGGITYPDIVGDNYNIKQLLAGDRNATNEDGSINVDVTASNALKLLFGSDKKSGIAGAVRRAAIANELPFLAKILYKLS